MACSSQYFANSLKSPKSTSPSPSKSGMCFGAGPSGSGAGKSAVVWSYFLPKSELNFTRHGPWPAKVSTVRIGKVRVAVLSGSKFKEAATTGYSILRQSRTRLLPSAWKSNSRSGDATEYGSRGGGQSPLPILHLPGTVWRFRLSSRVRAGGRR